MTLTREQEAFKQWADETFGPAPAGGYPQHERYASYFKAFNAGRARGLGEAVEVCKTNAKRWPDLRGFYVANECAAAIEQLKEKT